MIVAIDFLSIMTLTAIQPSSSRLFTVGARLPGVSFTALLNEALSILYVHKTYFCAAINDKH